MLNSLSLILPDGSWSDKKDKLFATVSHKPLFKTGNNGCKNIWQIGFDIQKSQLIILHGNYETSKGFQGSLKLKRVDVKCKCSRTVEEQCFLESNRRFENKKKLGYSDKIGELIVGANKIPMLASRLGKNCIFPVSGMPKLDGVRCVSFFENGNVVTQSRNGKIWPHFEHLKKDLLKIFELLGEEIILDGELYVHGMDFSELISIVQKSKNGVHEKLNQLEYHIFDMMDKKLEWSERYKILKGITKLNCSNIKLVDEFEVCDLGEVNSFCDKYLESGYEGLMLRFYGGKKSLYVSGRTTNLLKVKQFFELEAEIIDIVEGKTVSDGAVIFVVKYLGKEFNVVPVGDIEKKSQYLSHRKEILGKNLTVKYQEMSRYGIPRFPVGKSIRNYD